MKRKVILLLTLLVALTSVASAAPSAQVTLSIRRDRTPAGLSVPLTLRIRNGAEELHLGQGVRVRVTPATGEPFIAIWGEGLDVGLIDVYPADGTPIVIGAHETYMLVLPAVDLSRPSWALDQRLLSTPGAYRFEVLLYDARTEPVDGVREPVAVSSAATLHIDVPDARDLDIWETIRRKEHWAIADAVHRDRPDSVYFPYLASLTSRGSVLGKATAMARAIELHPSTPLVPWLRAGIAYFYEFAAVETFDLTGDLEAALRHSDRARAELLRLQAVSDVWAKVKAKQRLEVLPGRTYFADLQRMRRSRIE